jgi:Domain of unknown function (DUF222)
VSETPAFASTGEALGMLRTVMGYLSSADATEMAAEAQAECLMTLEQMDAVKTAARARVLRAFTAGQGYAADADYSPRSWLIHRTRITRGAAAGHLAWARRAAAHPRVIATLADGDISESYARKICQWSDKLPPKCRDAADSILLAAAADGAHLADVADLASEMYAQSLPASDDDQPDETFADRRVTVESTFGGAGVISGDLSSDCTSIVKAVLESLSAPMGAEDTRTREQRYHDALHEAMKRLAASDLLPERAGQPVKAVVHVSLAELRAMDDGSVLEVQWVTAIRARWAGRRAAASEGGSDGAAWLSGDAAQAAACDATLLPVVTGDLDVGVLDDLVRLSLQLAGHGPHCTSRPGPEPAGEPGPGPARPASPDPAEAGPTGLQLLTSLSREAIQQAIIGKAVDLLSGPGGLASFLRTNQVGARLAGPSLPLDIGYSSTIPAGIRNAVILRDQHCRWPGGCHQPAAACEVHHVKHKAHGGPTSVRQCVLLCSFHHQVVIHRWGWTLVLNPDGTTTAWNPDRTKVLYSHGPPARAG